ncbi:MAG: hypothetical protein JWQ57_824 [Mucilaginibacter sp.]|nr:hypothetical protein [Mucilaginibacter sp.]
MLPFLFPTENAASYFRSGYITGSFWQGTRIFKLNTLNFINIYAYRVFNILINSLKRKNRHKKT